MITALANNELDIAVLAFSTFGLAIQNAGLTDLRVIADDFQDGAPGYFSNQYWGHKTANVLNKLPKSLHAKAKRALQDIWMAETRKDAEAAFDGFIECYGVKYEKAAECLSKDRDSLLAFYDFPAEHWKHLRTTNPIESTFATVRHRTVRSRGCLSNKTALAMVFNSSQTRGENSKSLDVYGAQIEVFEISFNKSFVFHVINT